MGYSYNYQSPHESTSEPKKIIPIRIYVAPVLRIYKTKIIKKVLKAIKTRQVCLHLNVKLFNGIRMTGFCLLSVLDLSLTISFHIIYR